MKWYVLIFLIPIFFLSDSCKKESGCKPLSPDVEDPQIVEYNIKNGVGAQKINNSIYYKAIDSGYGVRPSRSSKVVVTYTAKLLNNKVFDAATTPKTFTLTDVIEGWQIGLPLIKKGGKIVLIIPSVYAYGCNGNSNLNVPGDAVLVYEVTLLDVIP